MTYKTFNYKKEIQKKQNMDSYLVFSLLGILLVGLVGWISNIVQIVGLESLTTGVAIVKILGVIVVPLGVIMGLIGLF